MSALAFLAAAGWRPERGSHRNSNWHIWLLVALFYAGTLAIILWEGM